MHENAVVRNLTWTKELNKEGSSQTLHMPLREPCTVFCPSSNLKNKAIVMLMTESLLGDNENPSFNHVLKMLYSARNNICFSVKLNTICGHNVDKNELTVLWTRVNAELVMSIKRSPYQNKLHMQKRATTTASPIKLCLTKCLDHCTLPMHMFEDTYCMLAHKKSTEERSWGAHSSSVASALHCWDRLCFQGMSVILYEYITSQKHADIAEVFQILQLSSVWQAWCCNASYQNKEW